MPFEKFEETGRGRGQGTVKPIVSLRKSGSIGINSTAMEEFFEDAEAAIMYYDEEENRVGIRPVDSPDADEHAYTISMTEGTGTITPVSFLEHHNLVPEMTTQYRPEWNGNHELVVVDLDEPIATYGSPEGQEDAAAEEAAQ